MLLVIEPVFRDFQHAPVNAGHLRAVALAFPTEKIAFAAHPTHRAAVFDILGPDLRDRFVEYDVAPPPAGGITFTRFRAQAEAMGRLIRALAPTHLLCLAATPETLFALRLMVALWRNLRVTVVLHGMLADTVGWRSRDPRRRFFDDRSALNIADHPRIRFVALEKIIRQQGADLGRLDPARCDVWPHVINPEEFCDVHHMPEPGRLRIGFLGFATEDKGFSTFRQMARAAQAHPGGAFEFRAIGGLAEHLGADDGSITSTGLGLARPRFLAEVRALDFVFLALDDRRYTLTSSGSAMDCIAALRPVIALDGIAVRHYVASPPVGLIAADAGELVRLVERPAILADAGNYVTYRDNLRRLQAERSPQALAELVGATLTVLEGKRHRPEAASRHRLHAVQGGSADHVEG